MRPYSRARLSSSDGHRPRRLGLLRCDDPVPELQSICSTYSDIFADFVRQLHAERRKMFGVCFGHQMIAHALGGTVQRAPHGWTVGANVWNLHERRSWMDPPSDEIRLIHSYQDQVLSLPHGGVVLAGADRCPIAMLAVGGTPRRLAGPPRILALLRRSAVREPHSASRRRSCCASQGQPGHAVQPRARGNVDAPLLRRFTRIHRPPQRELLLLIGTTATRKARTRTRRCAATLRRHPGRGSGRRSSSLDRSHRIHRS